MENKMSPDVKMIEQLVETITREVLLAIAEKEEMQKNADGSYCVVDIA
jgi:hypothetical protein